MTHEILTDIIDELLKRADEAGANARTAPTLQYRQTLLTRQDAMLEAVRIVKRRRERHVDLDHIPNISGAVRTRSEIATHPAASRCFSAI